MFRFSEEEELQAERDRCIQYLREHTVCAGLPSSAPERDRFVLAVQERGSPLLRIPPRPVIQPGLEDARREMAGCLLKAAQAAAEGDLPGVRRGLEKAGEAGVEGIRGRIDAGLQPPNAPVTVRGGWLRNRVSGKSVQIKGKGFNKPLYDTGELYRAFGYEIKKKSD